MTSPSSMHETRHSKLVHYDNPEGWDGERGGRGIQDGRVGEEGDTCTLVADSCKYMSKTTTVL